MAALRCQIYADVAQLEEHFPRKEEDGKSRLLISAIISPHRLTADHAVFTRVARGKHSVGRPPCLTNSALLLKNIRHINLGFYNFKKLNPNTTQGNMA